MAPNKKILSRLRTVAVLAACWLLISPASFAHPMGNFSISHYTGIRIEQGSIELHYLIDMAEIPAFQEMQQNNFVARADDSRVRAYLSKQAEAFGKDLLLTLNGQQLPLQIVSQDILFTPGAGNLPTMKFGLVYRAEVSDVCRVSRCELEYRDANFAGRVGWKEIITSLGRGVTIESSSVPSYDRSSQLSNYPTDLIKSPPQEVTAKIAYQAAATPATTAGPRVTKGGMTGKPTEMFLRVAATAATNPQSAHLYPNQQGAPR